MATKNAKAKEIKPRFDKEKAKQWGSPDYMMMRYDDLQEVEEMSRKCKGTKAVKAAVKAVSTPKDNLRVYKVYRTTICIPGEPTHEGVVAHLTVGLNSDQGRQADYLEALAKLVKDGTFQIFDAYVDAVDDLADFLVSYGKPYETKGV